MGKVETRQLIANRCRAKLAERRIKLNSVAQILGVSDATIYLKMSGGSDLTVNELFMIASSCNFTREDVNFIIFGS